MGQDLGCSTLGVGCVSLLGEVLGLQEGRVMQLFGIHGHTYAESDSAQTPLVLNQELGTAHFVLRGMDLGAGVLSSTPRHLASDPDAYSGGGTNTGWTLYRQQALRHPEHTPGHLHNGGQLQDNPSCMASAPA